MGEVVAASLILTAAAFAAVYYPLLNTLARGLASPYAKVDIRKRFAAALVDLALVATSAWLSVLTRSVAYAFSGAVYIVLRDSFFGRSLGKFCFGLVVADLYSGLPCGRAGSLKRNAVFLVPGANIAAVFLESATIVSDVQGQRLGDRMAHTQVVEGLGAKDLAAAFMRGWRDFIANLDGNPRRRDRERQPARRRAA